MKKSSSINFFTSVVFSFLLIAGSASQAKTEATAETASKASPEATAAINTAGGAIKKAKANDWIWRDTEKFLKQAQAAADKGDNATAIKLAKKARFQADMAITQYKFEKANPRGM
jgi:hypothetical protein